ncbi:MAG: sugar phosphate isomerase/epimerase [Caldilineaceae bacterium]
MEIGIFSRTFVRPTLGEVLDAVVGHGLHAVQFNLACAGLAEMPDEVPPALITTIREAMAARGITMAALSGTYNMIHPDLAARAAGLRQLRVLAAACAGLGTSVITLCTGTRNTASMWRPHPDNSSPAAWLDLRQALDAAVAIADEYNVTLAFEPEVSNVLDSAPRSRRMLDEVGSPRLKVVMDGANIFHHGELPHMTRILTEAFDLLGGDIVLAHAKDLDRDGEAGHVAAGEGLLDYGLYLRLLHASGYDGPLVLHGLSEAQTPGCIRFLQDQLAQVG